MKKLSLAIRLIAVLLILNGAGRVAVVAFGLVVFSRAMEPIELSPEWEKVLSRTVQRGAISPEEAVQRREQAKKVREQQGAFPEFRSWGAVQVLALITSLLGMGKLIAGIGILMLRDWARTLAVWQSGLWIAFSFSFQLLLRVSQKFHNVILGHQQVGHTVGQWVMFFCWVILNGYLI